MSRKWFLRLLTNNNPSVIKSRFRRLISAEKYNIRSSQQRASTPWISVLFANVATLGYGLLHFKCPLGWNIPLLSRKTFHPRRLLQTFLTISVLETLDPCANRVAENFLRQNWGRTLNISELRTTFFRFRSKFTTKCISKLETISWTGTPASHYKLRRNHLSIDLRKGEGFLMIKLGERIHISDRK